MKLTTVKTIILKDDPRFGELDVHEFIQKYPNELGLDGNFDSDSVTREHLQISGGRVDLLFKDKSSNKRYTVEVQLGATDETHIIRTIEYWDLERKRYPNHEYCAVIVAEDITGRFFNVINLFNNAIPIIAINMTAVQNSDNTVGLLFTKVLDENKSMDESVKEPATRDYWVKGWPNPTELAEHLCRQLGIEPYYHVKGYIGTRDSNASKSLLYIGCTKKMMIPGIVMSQTPQWDDALQKSALQNDSWRYGGDAYRIWFSDKQQIDDNLELVKKLYRAAVDESKAKSKNG